MVGKTIFYIMVLIGIFLVATHGGAINSILKTLSSASLQGVATLQGRDVLGVTK